MIEANFQKANLRGANLYCAGLLKANLEGADLRDTILENAHFEDANLLKAVLDDAIKDACLDNTIMPDGQFMTSVPWQMPE